MSLFTSSAPTNRSTVAYFLAIFVLLGGLASLHNHGDLTAMFDAQWSKTASSSARSIAQDKTEFSWDTVRIRVDLLDYTCNHRSYYSFRLQKNFTGTNVFQNGNAPVL